MQISNHGINQNAFKTLLSYFHLNTHLNKSQVTTRLQGTDTTAQHTPTWSITNKNDPQKKHRLGTISKNTFTGELKPVSLRQPHP